MWLWELVQRKLIGCHVWFLSPASDAWIWFEIKCTTLSFAINVFNLPHVYLVCRHYKLAVFLQLFLSISLLYIWNRTYVHFLRLVPSVLPVVSVRREQTQQILCVLVCYILRVCVLGNIHSHEGSAFKSLSLFCQNVKVVKKKSHPLCP